MAVGQPRAADRGAPWGPIGACGRTRTHAPTRLFAGLYCTGGTELENTTGDPRLDRDPTTDRPVDR